MENRYSNRVSRRALTLLSGRGVSDAAHHLLCMDAARDAGQEHGRYLDHSGAMFMMIGILHRTNL